MIRKKNNKCYLLLSEGRKESTRIDVNERKEDLILNIVVVKKKIRQLEAVGSESGERERRML